MSKNGGKFMSRMERYHHETEQPVENPVQSPQKKPKKKKGWFRRIFSAILFVVLLAVIYCVGGFLMGVHQAKNDDSIPKVTVDEFHGDPVNGETINVLLIGSDSRGEDQGRSDSLMIAHYNKKTDTPKLVSIMRDTYVNIPGYGYNKINASYSFGGAELVKETIKENFGVPIHYYAIVNFESFPKIINTLFPGGLKIDAEKDLDLDGTFIKKGWQKMNGIEVLQYARFRKDAESDFGRVRRQQQVLTAMMNQAVQPQNIVRLPVALGKVQGYTSTNVPTNFYLTISKDLAVGKLKPLEKLTIPVEGTYWDGYYEDAGSVLEIDEAAEAKALQDFLRE